MANSMKYFSKYSHLFQRILLITALVFCLPFNTTYAQSSKPTVTNKSSDNSGFKKLADFNNPESGSSPVKIIVSGNWLYGINYQGGKYNEGTIFKIKTDGSDFHKFDFSWGGANPSSLALSDSILYGTTNHGDAYNEGDLYKINADFTKEDILYFFRNDFEYPDYDIIVSDSIIYGVAFEGLGSNGYVFKVDTDGTGFAKLNEFYDAGIPTLIKLDNYLYMYSNGSYNDAGHICKFKTDGTEYQTLCTFGFESEDGANITLIIILGNTIYGTTKSGGINNAGTFFKIGTDGNNFEKLYDFSNEDTSEINWPMPLSLVSAHNVFYGVTYGGGKNGYGAIFRINRDGSGFKNLYYFQDTINGRFPYEIVMSGDTLFGSTVGGGKYSSGTIFRYNIDKSQTYSNDQINVIKLPTTESDQINISIKKNLIIKKGNLIDLDTTFTVSGDIPYIHSWEVKSGIDFEVIDKNAEICQDSTFYLFITTNQGCIFKDSVAIRVDSANYIKSIEAEGQISIYPNPNIGKFQIKIPGYANYTYNIIDIKGAIIADGNINCTTEECVFDIELVDAKSGIYTITIKKRGEFFGQKKFIISK
jgi:uncharacterized repeat protein (TIGR03803 family)